MPKKARPIEVPPIILSVPKIHCPPPQQFHQKASTVNSCLDKIKFIKLSNYLYMFIWWTRNLQVRQKLAKWLENWGGGSWANTFVGNTIFFLTDLYYLYIKCRIFTCTCRSIIKLWSGIIQSYKLPSAICSSLRFQNSTSCKVSTSILKNVIRQKSTKWKRLSFLVEYRPELITPSWQAKYQTKKQGAGIRLP